MEGRLKWLFLVLALIIVFGTSGFVLIEGWGILDSLYMTIITLSTVGFKEVRSLSAEGRVFVIILIVFGVGGAFYTITVVGRMIVGGEIREILGRRKMEKSVRNLESHYIICGYGRVGGKVCEEFKKKGIPLVVIDNQPQIIEQVVKDGLLFVQGDATEDSVLTSAGIEKAKGLASTIPQEADNVFVVLSARQLNPKLFIIARSDRASSEKKLLRAGANKVISPYESGGSRMAMAILRPNVVDFMRVAALDEERGLAIEEVEVKSGSSIIGKELRDSPIRSELGITVIGIKKKDENMLFNPSPDTKVEVGDVLVVIGEIGQLDRLEKMTHA